MWWSDEVSSCKDASTHVLLKMKLDRKLRQPSVLASTGKSMSFFFFFFCWREYWMRLCISCSQWMSLEAQVQLSCIEIASMYVWWRETKQVCPGTCDCKEGIGISELLWALVAKTHFLNKSLNSEDLIMLQLISEFSLVCWSANVLAQHCTCFCCYG